MEEDLVDGTDEGFGLYGKGLASSITTKEKMMDERLVDATNNFDHLRKIEVKEQSYSAEGLLEDGLKVLAKRGKQYDPAGKVERSMEKIVKAFGVVTGKDLTEAEGWMFMAILKAVRSFQRPGFHADSAQDFVNYAALYGEAKAKEDTVKPSVVVPKAPTTPLDTWFTGTLGEAIPSVRKNAAEGIDKVAAESKSYLAQQLNAADRFTIKQKAYQDYEAAAIAMGLPHAISWMDMHPIEQASWLAVAIGVDDKPSNLPIFNPADRKKDPTTGLDDPEWEVPYTKCKTCES